jgi:plastocyanin
MMYRAFQRRFMRELAFTALVVAMAACSSSSTGTGACGQSGANANVNATDSKVFSPNGTTITHGQSVCWQNNGTLTHSVTADNTSFNGTIGPGQTFVQAFPTVGSFSYHCIYHPAMTGTVTVN